MSWVNGAAMVAGQFRDQVPGEAAGFLRGDHEAVQVAVGLVQRAQPQPAAARNKANASVRNPLLTRRILDYIVRGTA